MSSQLEKRLHELDQERARLRESIRRIGQTFASNLDRQALLDLALRTALDAVQAGCGRLSARTKSDEPLTETVRVGSLDGLEQAIHRAERDALNRGGLGEARVQEIYLACTPLLPLDADGRVHGLI